MYDFNTYPLCFSFLLVSFFVLFVSLYHYVIYRFLIIFPSLQKSYWFDVRRRRKFFEDFASRNGIDPLNPKHWYAQPKLRDKLLATKVIPLPLSPSPSLPYHRLNINIFFLSIVCFLFLFLFGFGFGSGFGFGFGLVCRG